MPDVAAFVAVAVAVVPVTVEASVDGHSDYSYANFRLVHHKAAVHDDVGSASILDFAETRHYLNLEDYVRSFVIVNPSFFGFANDSATNLFENSGLMFELQKFGDDTCAGEPLARGMM